MTTSHNETPHRTVDRERPKSESGPSGSVVALQRRGEQGVPLSIAQQSFWLLDSAAAGGAFNLIRLWRLRGALSVTALRQALRIVVGRHEILRSRIVDAAALPHQLHDTALEIDLEVIDAELSADGYTRAIERLIGIGMQPLNLRSGPPFGVTLTRLADGEHLLLLVMHHIAADATSLRVFVDELAACYAAAVTGSDAYFGERPMQYREIAQQQRLWLGDHASAAGAAFWRSQLADAPTALELSGPKRAVVPPRGAQLKGRWSPKALAGFIDWAASTRGMPLGMAYFTAYVLLLAYRSGQRDFVIGLPVQGRTRRETRNVIGPLVNPLAVRIRLPHDPTLDELADAVRRAWLCALRHQDYPLEQAIRDAKREDPVSWTMPYNVFFNFYGFEPAALTLDGLVVEALEVGAKAAKFDLSLTMRTDEGGVNYWLEYDAAQFEEYEVRGLLQQYRAALDVLPGSGNRRLSGIELTPGRRVEPTAEPAHAFTGECAWELIAKQAAMRPSAIAIAGDDDVLSYADLERCVDGMATRLAEAGCGAETIVGVCLERSPACVVALLAIMTAGAVYLPLDPSLPDARLQSMLDAAKPWVVLVETGTVARIANVHATVIDVHGYRDARDVASERTRPTRGALDRLAYVIYTSGSTGEPKGVMATHRGLANRLEAQDKIAPFRPGDIGCQKTALGFVDSFVEMLAPLAAGATLVIVSDAIRSDADRFIEWLATRNVTHLITVPSFAAALVPDLARIGPELRLRYWTLSGESMRASLAATLQQLLPTCRFANVYGSSEVAADATFALISSPVTEPLPIGRPLPGMVAHLLDDAMRPVAPGATGELYVGGTGLARGYLGSPLLTAAHFVPSPFEPGDRLYRTGDLARHRADGQLEYLSRRDRRVKIRGQRVELDEVERQLREHEALRDAAVTTDQDTHGETRVVAHIVVRADRVVTGAQLRADLGRQLVAAAVPSAFLVHASDLPRTRSGKIDYTGLPSAANSANLPQGAVIDGPETRIEADLLAIWRDVLRLDRVALDANFADLGGHSLLGMQIVSRIRQIFGVDIPLRVLLGDRSDIRRVAAFVASSAVAEERALLAAPCGSPSPLSFTQERIWFLQQLYPDNTAYHEAMAFRFKGALDVPALERSLGELVARHGSLRTRFVEIEGQPRQVVEASQAFVLPIVDLPMHAGPDAAGAAVAETLGAMTGTPFDLAKAPPVRIRLLRSGQGEFVLALVLHHIVCDAWSLRSVLPRELGALYAAHAAGAALRLPEPRAQYSDFARLQRDWLRGPVLARHVDYWQARLAGMPTVLDLPTDHPRPARRDFRGERVSLAVPAACVNTLAAIGRQHHATLFMVLLAAFQWLLARWSGQRDIVVASPTAGRSHLETEGMLGLFMNAIILRADSVHGDLTFGMLLSRVREAALEAFEHEAVPFEALAKALDLGHDLSRNPLFQVMFALQNVPRDTLDLPGIAVTPLAVPRCTAKVDLFLQVSETPDGLEGSVEYALDLFERATVEQLRDQYVTLLQSIAECPDRSLSALSTMTVAQRRQIVEKWSGYRTGHAGDATLHALFEQQARRTPMAVALVARDDSLTYRELDRRSTGFARHLRSVGVGSEDIVALCLERSIETVVALLGILKAGAAYLPLDPRFPAERLREAFELAGDPWLVTRSSLLARVPRSTRAPILLDTDRTAIESQESHALHGTTHPDGIACLLLTSGSTGRPKCVAATHRMFSNRLQWNAGDPDERYLHRTLPIFVDAIWELFMPLTRGQVSVVIDDALAQQLPALIATLAAHRVTRLAIVPSLLEGLLETVPNLGDRLPALTHVTCGGEAMSSRLAQAFGQQCPGVSLVNAYGLSEVWDVCDWVAEPHATAGRILIGRPLPNVQVYVLDTRGEPVAIGERGELCVGGAGLARGYWHGPSLTAERFVPSPFGDGARLYRTGDLVRWRSDGQLEYLGRQDHQVKLNAQRIETAEIERVLRLHEAVRDAAVVAPREPDTAPRLIAYVGARYVSDLPDEATLRQHARRWLPEYMVPATIIVLDSLPQTPSGKLDRASLPAAPRRYSAVANFAPQTPTQQAVAQDWCALLGCERIALDDRFFDIGGDSLAAMKAVSRAAEQFGVVVPLRTLYERPTVKSFCAWLDERLATQLAGEPSGSIVVYQEASRGAKA